MESTNHPHPIEINPEIDRKSDPICDIVDPSTLQNVYVIEHGQPQLVTEEDILQQLIQKAAPVILKQRSDNEAGRSSCGSDMAQDSDMVKFSEFDMTKGSESDMPKSSTPDAADSKSTTGSVHVSDTEFKCKNTECNETQGYQPEFSKKRKLEQPSGSCDSTTAPNKTPNLHRTSIFILTPQHQCKEASCSSSDLNRNKLKQILQLAKLLETGQDLTKFVNAEEETSTKGNKKKHEKFNRKYICNLCKKRFKSAHALEKHASCHTQGVCKEKGAKETLNRAHIVDEGCVDHQRTHSSEKERRPFRCPICQKCFKTKQYARQHEKIHSGYSPFQCDRCDKWFRTLSVLKQHNQGHYVFSHTCTYCNKGFQVKRQLDEHLRTHTGERPYTCGHCQRAFALKRTLVIHLRTHTGHKPWICDYCGKQFPTSGRLKEHSRIHTGEKPYACTQCPKRFVQWQQLRAHSKTHQTPAEILGEASQPHVVHQMVNNTTQVLVAESTKNITEETTVSGETSGIHPASKVMGSDTPTSIPVCSAESRIPQIGKVFSLPQKSLASSSPVVTVPECQSTSAPVIVDENVMSQDSLASSLPVVTVLESQSTSAPVTGDEDITTHESLVTSLPVVTVPKSQSISAYVTVDEIVSTQDSLATSLPEVTVPESQPGSTEIEVPIIQSKHDESVVFKLDTSITNRTESPPAHDRLNITQEAACVDGQIGVTTIDHEESASIDRTHPPDVS